MSEPQDKFISLNSLRFHYLDWGNAAAPPLVLLHGVTSHAHSWDTFARAVCDNFHVLALDQRGHGETEWATDYGFDRMVEDVDVFARAMQLMRFYLVGLSMGGRNAYGYAAQHPEALDRLVIVDIGPELNSVGGQRIRAGMLASDVFDEPDEAYQRMRAANTHAPDAELHHRVAHALKRRDDGKWTFRYDKALRDPNRPRPQPDPIVHWAMLAKISCPTLLVRGSESDVLSRETAERMTREIPNCRLVEVQNSGHSVPLDNPNGFIEATRPFLLEKFS